MTKSFLAGRIAIDGNMSEAVAKRVLRTIEQVTRDALATTGKATVPGIGTLRIAQREAREGRNPRTGAKIKIAARKAVTFSATSDLTSHAQKCKVAA